jgi:predicted HTH domain antitoxin
MRKKGVNAIDSILDLIEDLNNDEIILYVYATSPEWATASKIRDVIKNSSARLSLAEKMYKNNKISIEKAAEIAGKPLVEITLLLGAAGN